MAAYRTCPQCGANLDLNETCNCQKEKEWETSIDMLISSLNVYELEMAYEKLKQQKLSESKKEYCLRAICSRAEALKSICTARN